ncbi:hypothetical protein AB0F95_20915 [Micromonospora tulbaghiae]|uniref:hypothetical protein n=1 Tax=Micromonospora tulbaghiae TaxID=479978 RepID=UPI0033FB2257
MRRRVGRSIAPAIRIARQKRLELIVHATERLMARRDMAAGTANAKVLLNRNSSRAVVRSTNHVATMVLDSTAGSATNATAVHGLPRRWLDAAVEVRDKVVETRSEVGAKVLGTGAEVKQLSTAVITPSTLLPPPVAILYGRLKRWAVRSVSDRHRRVPVARAGMVESRAIPSAVVTAVV